MTYFDTSALVSLHQSDRHSVALSAYLRRTRPAVAISRFAAAEFASAVSIRLRTGNLRPEQATALLHAFDDWRPSVASVIEVTANDLITCEAFVRRFDLQLKAPDALHLALCAREGLPLLTFDLSQARAAEALRVPVVAV